MKKNLLLLFFIFLTSCSEKEETKPNPHPLALGFIVENQTHKVIIWINAEPRRVFAPGESGPFPLGIVGKKGSNQVHLTTENTSTDQSEVRGKVIEGSWMEPEKMKTHFTWSSSKQTDTSPDYSFEIDEALMPLKSGLQAISITKEEARNEVLKYFRKSILALENRDLSQIDMEKDKLNNLMKKMVNVDDFYQKVFEIDDYSAQALVEAEDLEVVIGKNTILGYSKKGGHLMKAGPLDRDSATGEVTYTYILQSISLGFNGQEWVSAY